MKQSGTFIHAGETPVGCHLSNRGYLLTLSLRSIASITTGYSTARPLGESITKASPIND